MGNVVHEIRVRRRSRRRRRRRRRRESGRIFFESAKEREGEREII